MEKEKKFTKHSFQKHRSSKNLCVYKYRHEQNYDQIHRAQITIQNLRLEVIRRICLFIIHSLIAAATIYVDVKNNNNDDNHR